MQHFHREILNNGLTIITVPNIHSKLCCVSVLYKVGSRDENPNRTGMAHLFEHLMFSNCGNSVDFDNLIQNAGGDCNAFTTHDTTQYYNVAPVSQLELLLQLEALRMNGFNISLESFKIQQKVVIEEFSEHYLNNPYGMFSHDLMPLAYQIHPYQWPVIGKNIDQLKKLSFTEIKTFKEEYYTARNAILVVVGNFEHDSIMKNIIKYFDPIQSNSLPIPKLSSEPPQIERRELVKLGKFPEEALYIAFHGCDRKHKDYYALDFATDILSEGKSSVLYRKLKKEYMIYSSVDCYTTSTFDAGLIIFEGKLMKDKNIEEGIASFKNVIDELKINPIQSSTFQKYLNKNESAYLSSQIGVVNQALNFSYAEWLGDANLVNNELEKYQSVSILDIQQAFNRYFNFDAASYLIYKNQEGQEVN